MLIALKLSPYVNGNQNLHNINANFNFNVSDGGFRLSFSFVFMLCINTLSKQKDKRFCCNIKIISLVHVRVLTQEICFMANK